ncbi:YhgE/Pip domain-containing protein [Geomicrobium sp. JCM 19038]|uniref:YhgE/Pip domain-containing protein n=1 Tax=Geomicrobium sp. JCM 19038 TaxID=1460635 RepID=UPI00045F337F|nr:YhgE/Pip domain-containing protein [Geomicrobium sp. JCM 19038]GAK08598.1 phage infection protein [Geomicrobium sp. JCM 19038]
MKGFLNEWKAILKNKKMSIGILGIMVIPVLYGGLLLWAFWDPYGEIENLPVAIVNEDTGTEVNDEFIHAGDEFVETLFDDESFQFEVTDYETAQQGLTDFDYYFFVHVPEDFSEHVTSVQNDHPEQGVLYYEINEDMNFVSSQLGSQAITQMEHELSQTLTESYVEVANDAYSTLLEAVVDLRDGALEIADGTESAYENMHSLVNGLSDLEVGANTLHDGIQEAALGTGQLKEEIVQFNHRYETSDEGNQLIERLDTLEHEVQQALRYLESEDFANLRQSLQSLETEWQNVRNTLHDAQSTWSEWEHTLNENQQAITNASNLLEQIERMNDGLQQANSMVTDRLYLLDEQIDQCESEEEVCAHLEELSHSLTQLSADLEEQTTNVDTAVDSIRSTYDEVSTTLITGQQEISEWVDDVNASFTQLNNSLPQELGTGNLQQMDLFDEITATLYTLEHALSQTDAIIKTIETTLNEATEAVSELHAGLEQLDEGSDELTYQMHQAKSGGEEIKKGIQDLDDGAHELHEHLTTLSDVLLDYELNENQQALLSSPVQSASEGVQQDYSYGEGLAPYFLSLALYVGGLTLSIIYPFRDPLAAHETGWQWFSGKLGVVWTVSTVQAAALLAVVFWGLDLSISNPILFSLFLWFSSLAFMALILMLVAILDNPGRFIGIILLIIQLGGSGGSFPVELVPAPFQWVHEWLPMTYTVLGMRATVHMDRPELLYETWPLVVMMVITLTLTFLYFHLKMKKQNKKADSTSVEEQPA